MVRLYDNQKKLNELSSDILKQVNNQAWNKEHGQADKKAKS